MSSVVDNGDGLVGDDEYDDHEHQLLPSNVTLSHHSVHIVEDEDEDDWEPSSHHAMEISGVLDDQDGLPPATPWRTIIFTVVLVLFGTTSICLGTYFLVIGHPGVLACFVIGSLALIPGCYQLYRIISACRGGRHTFHEMQYL